MFSFATGTDPEVFLLLEAGLQDGRPQWFYAFAASTSVRAFGLYNDKQVWDNTPDQANRVFVFNFNR